jgi:hypothetical protein
MSDAKPEDLQTLIRKCGRLHAKRYVAIAKARTMAKQEFAFGNTGNDEGIEEEALSEVRREIIELENWLSRHGVR